MQSHFQKIDSIELFDKWYDENYDEWAEVEEGIALREELEQAFKSGIATLEKENAELKELIEKYRQAVDKCLHITFMGGGCEVNTIGQYATLVDGYLTDVEGLAKWKK